MAATNRRRARVTEFVKPAIVLIALMAAPARADELPPPPPPPANLLAPWILGDGMLRLDATLELGMSAGRVGKPIALAPDVWYGVTDDLTLGIIHSKFATTGFRGSAGAALCLTGTSNGCTALYNNVGLEAWYALLRGQISLAGGGGALATNVDSSLFSIKLGFKVKLTSGSVSVMTMPSIFVAANKRDNMTSPNPDVLYLPIALAIKIAPKATIGLSSGIRGPVQQFADKWVTPIGVSIGYTVGHAVLGASWVFGAIVSGANNPPPPMPAVEGMDLRTIQLWVAYSIPVKKH